MTFAFAFFAFVVAAADVPWELTTEYRENPVGIDATCPRMSWKLPKGVGEQRAYELEIDGRALGRVDSDRQIGVAWPGNAVEGNERHSWRVRVWNAEGPTDWSRPATFVTGVKSWSAQWLASRDPAATPRFMKRFSVRPGLATATLHVTGVGFYEATLNGAKVGDKVLDPSQTDYNRRVQYSTFVLDKDLRVGENELAVTVGHGWFDQRATGWDFEKAPWRDRPCAIAQLELRYEDGAAETVRTDASWRETDSGILYDDIREGETQTGFVSDEERVPLCVPGPKGRLVCASQPGAKKQESFRPVSIERLADDVWLIDFGVGISGWARFEPDDSAALKGHKVHFTYDERKPPAARHIDVYVSNYGSRTLNGDAAAFQTDHRTFAGRPGEAYEPRFVYHGFRYLTIRGLGRKPEANELTAFAVNTDFKTISSFACGNEDLNALMRLIDRSYRSNFTDGVPTDCPHREKGGWTGDASMASGVGMYFYENTAGYEKWLRDFVDAQRPDGALPGIIPTSGWGYEFGWEGRPQEPGPCFDSALPTILWRLYRYRDDRRILEELYPTLAAHLDHLAAIRDDRGLIHCSLGDWSSPGGNVPPIAYCTTACFTGEADVAAKVADVLGKKEDAARFRRYGEEARTAVRRAFLNDDGTFADASQSAATLALSFRLYENNAPRDVLRGNLLQEVEECGGRFSVGILGMSRIGDELSAAGAADQMVRMILNPEEPSPKASWLDKGLTGCAEHFDRGLSWNHIMFGSFGSWVYAHLAGIRLGAANAFKDFIVAPEPVRSLGWVRATVGTPYGTIGSSWTIDGDEFRLSVDVPDGTTATIRLPDGQSEAAGPGRHALACRLPSAPPRTRKSTHRHDPMHWVEAPTRDLGPLLKSVELRGADEETCRRFYTALYRDALAFENVADAEGNWKGPDGTVHNSYDGRHLEQVGTNDLGRLAVPLMELLYEPGFADALAFSPVHRSIVLGPIGGAMHRWIPYVADAWFKPHKGYCHEKALVEMDRLFAAVPESDPGDYLCAVRLAEAMGRTDLADKWRSKAAKSYRIWREGDEKEGAGFAWACLGFHPEEAATDTFRLTTPLAPGAWLMPFGGNVFKIRTVGFRKGGKVEKVTLNGVEITDGFLRRDAVFAGGELVFRMAEPVRAKVTATADHADCRYASGETASVSFALDGTNGLPVRTGRVRVTVDNFGSRTLVPERIVDLAEENPIRVSATRSTPGFVRIRVTSAEPNGLQVVGNYNWGCDLPTYTCGLGYDVDKIVSGTPDVPDFDVFWSEAVANLEKTVPVDFRMEPRTVADANYRAYRVSVATLRGGRSWGWITEPKDASTHPYPLHLEAPGTGVGYDGPHPGIPGRIFCRLNVHPYEPCEGTGSAAAVGRQRLYDEQDNRLAESLGVPGWVMGGHFLLGIQKSREDYFYYASILGLNRLVDQLAARPECDASRIAYMSGSQGGWVGLALTYLNRHVARSVILVPAITDLMGGRIEDRQPGWPWLVEVYPPELQEAVAANAAYFCGVNFARRIRKPIRFAVGFADNACAPHAVFSAYNACPSDDRDIFCGVEMGHSYTPEVSARANAWVDAFFSSHGGKSSVGLRY